MRYDRFSRILHWCIAVSVVMQLVTEQWMARRIEDKAPDILQSLLLIAHEYGGFVVLIVVGVRFTLMLDNPDKGWLYLYPWLTAAGRRKLMDEIRREVPEWWRGRLKPPEQADRIARSVHGLGLALALALGLTGVALFIGTKPDGSTPGVVGIARQYHDMLGYAMWAYLFGHVLMALFHQRLGHRVLEGIFSLKDGQRG